jgi:hypothetical protein
VDVHEIVDQLGIWWPEGNSDQCRQAARCYRQTAAALGSVQQGCHASVGDVHACSSGPPFDAFDARWAKWEGSDGYLEITRQCCLGMADALEKYAQAMDDAVAKLIELVTIAATVLVGGIVLTIFTAGLSDAAAGAAVAAIVGEAAVEAGTMAAVIADITATVFFSAAFGFLEGLAIDSVVQLEHIEVFYDQKDWNWGEFWQSGGMGALGGAAGGGMGAGLARMGGKFAPGLLTGAGWGSRGARALVGAGVGGGSATIVDLAFTGSVNPLDVAIGTLAGAGGGAAARGRGPAAINEGQNSISNIGDGFSARNAAAMADFGPGTAFSGVYDPTTGRFSAYPSVDDPWADGAPVNSVPRYGGHSDIRSRLERLPDLRIDPDRLVAFTTFLEPDGSFSIGWRSRGVNGSNYGSIDAPEQFRQQIIDALSAATGRRVWSRT